MIKKWMYAIWSFTATIILAIGLVMIFGYKGAAEFMEDVKLRLQIELKVKKEKLRC